MKEDNNLNIQNGDMNFSLDDYKNNTDYRREVDRYVKQKLLHNLNSDNYDLNFFIDFAEKYLSSMAHEHPYIFETDIIIETLKNYINHLNGLWSFSNDEIERQQYAHKKAKVLQMLGTYRSVFSSKMQINSRKEYELFLAYDKKLKIAQNLTIDETEQLIRLYISGGIKRKKEDFLNYILRQIINNKYVIDDNLYQHIFLEKIDSILKKENINDINIIFVLFDEIGLKATFDDTTNTIKFDKSIIKSTNIIENFITFFHEKRHYHQVSGSEVNLASLEYAKDKFLKRILGMGYYFSNYKDISYEKDAMYVALKELYYFTLEVVPEKLEEMKKLIFGHINRFKSSSAKDTTERIKSINFVEEEQVENFNLYFEKVVKKNRTKFTNDIINGQMPLILLHEYGINGNKKSLFELFEERDQISKDENDKIDLYNYLIFDEEVSIEYILSNVALLSKNRDSKYYEEVKKVLKHKLITYYITKTQTSKNFNIRNDIGDINSFYDKIISRLKEINIRGLKIDRNIRKYSTKEEELKESYKELYCIFEEMKEQEKTTRGI